MRALVTGGAGLIGSHVVDLLLDEGHEVTILDNLDVDTHPHGRPGWLPGAARFVQGDVRCKDDLRTALEGVQWIFHQAAFGGFTAELSRYIDSNAIGTARLYEVLTEESTQVEKVVVASSQAIYGEGAYACEIHGRFFPQARATERLAHGDWEPRCPICEQPMAPVPTPVSAPANGETPYALSKLSEERLALATGRRAGIPTVALRYAITYGPRQSLFNPYTGVVSIFSTRLLNDLPPLLYEDGRQIRDFIFVEDVARANLHVMKEPAADGRAFNVGSGVAVRMDDLARLLADAYARPLAPAIVGDYRLGDARHIVHDVSELSDIGFHAVTPMSAGIQRFIAWISTQGDVQEYFTQAHRMLCDRGVVQSLRPSR